MSTALCRSSARRRILVVEDEYLIAQDTARALRRLAYEVVGPVPTVVEALASIAGEKLDAVLLDVNLGGVSSVSVAVELAARRTPFVVVTGYGSLDLAEAILQDAPRVTKPVATADLAATLAKTMAA